MNIPFHKQLNDYNCGPAAIQMVFDYFNNHIDQKILEKSLHTSRREGTTHGALIRKATREGFYCYVNNNSTLFEIKHFLSMGLPVVVNFVEPSNNEGHYAVVAGYKRKTLLFNDPWNGKGFPMLEKVFVRRWHGGDHISKRWIMVLAKENLRLGKQYLPKI
jgi:ABC-type bacteriocin/lantibiotic exporter with double-glycine peptidase domain